MDPRTAEHLRALELRLLEPEVRASAAALVELLAPDFIEFGSSGRRYDRPAIIAALRGERSSPPVERTIADLAVRSLAEDVALVTYRVARRAGDARSEVFLRSSIWRRSEGRWQMVFHQGTRSDGAQVVGSHPDNSPPKS